MEVLRRDCDLGDGQRAREDDAFDDVGAVDGDVELVQVQRRGGAALVRPVGPCNTAGALWGRSLRPGLALRGRGSSAQPPLCDIPSGCCSFTGPWTVTRSSLRMLRWIAAFCRPLRPVLLLVSFPRSRSPVVGVPGLCWRWRDVPFARQRRPIIGVLRMCWLLPGSFDCFCCPPPPPQWCRVVNRSPAPLPQHHHLKCEKGSTKLSTNVNNCE